MILLGGCYCGQLVFEVEAPLGPVFSCHCGFCRRTHGAAFTTAALVPADAVRWRPGAGAPATFQTPLGNVRHFCGCCAAPLWNLSPSLGLGVIIVGSLADELQPSPWAHVNVESKAAWFSIQDGLPQFSGWPRPGELLALCRQHPEAWVPRQLVEPAA